MLSPSGTISLTAARKEQKMFFRKNSRDDVSAAAPTMAIPVPPSDPPPAPRGFEQKALVTRTNILVVTSSLYPRLYFSVITAHPDKEGEEMLLNGMIDVDRDNGLALVGPGDTIKITFSENNGKWTLSRAWLAATVEDEKARLVAGSQQSNAASSPLPPRHPLRTPR
jgi:hypothetical protein